MAATFASEKNLLDDERRVLDAIAQVQDGLKLQDVATVSGLSVRAVSKHIRRLRGKGKVVRVNGPGHDVFYKRRTSSVTS